MKIGSKILGCLSAALFAALILFPVRAEAAVKINSTSFPDKAFREYVLTEVDENQDGELSTAETGKVVYLDLDAMGISDLKGIGRFPKLEVLDCGRNALTSLDLSKNTALRILDCSENQLTALDVSVNTQLVSLSAARNAGLELTGLENLAGLICLDLEDCGLASLDVAANTKLQALYCSGSSISALDIHLAPALVKAVTGKDRQKTERTASVLYEYVAEKDDEGIPLDQYMLEVDKTTKVAYARPSITTQPVSKTIEAGKKVTFKVTAKGGGLSYQWQYKKPGGSWVNVASSAGKKASYSFTAAASHYKYQYRCKVTNVVGKRFSTAVTLTVKTKPVITSPTKATTKTAKKGTAVSFSVKAYAAETYQWYFRTSSRAKWKMVTLSGCKKATLSVTATLARRGYQYRCKVTNPYGSAYSGVYTLKVRL